jgi:hypothetical protein
MGRRIDLTSSFVHQRFAPLFEGSGLAPDADLHDALPMVQADERAITRYKPF